MKILTARAVSLLAAGECRPVVLATLVARPAEEATWRWASQPDGEGDRCRRIGTTLYGADLVRVGRIDRSADENAAAGEIAIANPGDDDGLVSTLLAGADLDGATLTIALVLADGEETAADIIALATGRLDRAHWSLRTIALAWREAEARLDVRLPVGRAIDPVGYPYAPPESRGRTVPVVFGDLRGRAFDTETPASGIYPHVPCPPINAGRRRYALFDGEDASDRETLLSLAGQIVEVPTASRTIASGYVEIADYRFDLLLAPVRVSATSGNVVDAEHACTPDLDRYALVPAGETLFACLPGASAGIGSLGSGTTLVAADVAISVVYEKVAPLDSSPLALTIRRGTTALSGHTNVPLDGTGLAVATAEIGDHLSGWNDIRQLSMEIAGASGTSGGRVRRILARIVFRCDEAQAASAGLAIFRSQRGFVESAIAATDDYADGGWVRGIRSAAPLSHPADVAEAILRHRSWGCGLSAPALAASGPTLSAPLVPGTESVAISSAAGFAAGDLVLLDREMITVRAVDGTTLTVTRAAAGSRETCHGTGTVLYRFGAIPATDGVDSASIRGAASALYEPDGTELLANGGMEGFSAGGVATGWSMYDPDVVASCAAATGYGGRHAQQVVRTGGGGAHPGIEQANVAVASGEWYRLTGFARTASGTVSLQCAIVQSAESLVAVATLGTAWAPFSVDFRATGALLAIRLLNAGGAGATVQIDGVSLQRLVPWRVDFALVEPVIARDWLNKTFLPQTGLRLVHGANGRIGLRARRLADRVAAMMIDAGRIAVDAEGAPLLSVVRSPAADVVTGVAVRYTANALTGAYDGFTEVRADEASTGQVVGDVAGNALTVESSAALAPKDGAVETANIVANDRIVTLPSGNLVACGVVPGDWLVVETAWGTFLHAIVRVAGATGVEIAERPSQYAVPGRWSAGHNLYVAGGEVFATGMVSSPTEVAIFRDLDPRNFPVVATIAAGDEIHALASASTDGAGVRDEGCQLDRTRERRAMDRLARHGRGRMATVEALCIRDRRTAVFLRNLLFDAGDRAWIATVTTDLSTLALDVGDVVAVAHALVPGGSMTGEIVRQSVDPLAGRIEYVVRGE